MLDSGLLSLSLFIAASRSAISFCSSSFFLSNPSSTFLLSSASRFFCSSSSANLSSSSLSRLITSSAAARSSCIRARVAAGSASIDLSVAGLIREARLGIGDGSLSTAGVVAPLLGPHLLWVRGAVFAPWASLDGESSGARSGALIAVRD